MDEFDSNRKSQVEYRSTKDIIETLLKNGGTITSHTVKSVIVDMKMFLATVVDDNVYEVKISHKRERIPECDGKYGKFQERNVVLEHFSLLLKTILPNMDWHNGALVFHDWNRDYTISLVKKKIERDKVKF